MKSRSVVVTYSLLMIVLIGATAFLALEVRAYMENRDRDPLADIYVPPRNQEQVVNEMQQEREQERRAVSFAFNQTSAFSPIATRIPIPTPTLRPLPTPTPPVPAKGYTYKAVMPNAAMLVGYDHKDRYVKVGDIVEDPAIGNFKILETVASFSDMKVKVQHIESGVVGFITEKWTGK